MTPQEKAAAEACDAPQDEFSKRRADVAALCVERLFNAVSKSRRTEFVGELNDLYLFLDAAKKAAPDVK